MSAVNIVYSNSYYGRVQLEQLHEAERQSGRSSSDSLALNTPMQDTIHFSEEARRMVQETSEDMGGHNRDAFARNGGRG
ncbi:MAG: hypothetical protein IJD04_04810 [Desulfovibrionaceae bacterium]|nr:hypothetical protein [Desulfovibrionaceae bacterium]